MTSRTPCSVVWQNTTDRFPGPGPDLPQVVLVVVVQPLAFPDLLQGRRNLLDAEDHRAAGVEVHLTVAPHAVALEGLLGQEHDLLRGPAALDRGGGGGEDRLATPEAIDHPPRRLRLAVVVDTAHPVTPQGAFQTLHLLPVDLEAGRDDQGVVPDPPPGGEGEALPVRIDLPHPVPNPGDAARHDPLLGAFTGFLGHDARPDQGPEGLVVVLVAGFDDGDVRPGQPPLEAGRDRDAAAPAADDDELVSHRWNLLRINPVSTQGRSKANRI